MSLFPIAWCVALFGLLVFGLGLPLTAGLPLREEEKVALAPGVALVVIYLAAFAIYVGRLPTVCFLVLPAAAGAGVVGRWRPILAALRDPEARRLLGAYGLWTGWALGFLALVRCYFGIGAGATGDWLEHYQRTGFFLGHWQLDYRFIWLYPLPARPPLANLVTGALLALSRDTFACFQLFSTLQSTLVLLPGWLLCRRFNGGRAAPAAFLLLCLLNPLLLHNATYPWTKLVTAYFVLAGLHLFLAGRERASIARTGAAFWFLAAGLLAHYSAGPYLLVLALLHLWSQRGRWCTGVFAAGLAVAAVPSVLLLATWFGWSWRHYGFAATTASNTAVTSTDVSSAGRFAAEKLDNVVFSLVPRSLREPGYLPPTEPYVSPAVTADQHFYLFYQLALLSAFGFAGAVLLPWRLARRARDPAVPAGSRRFWAGFLAATILLGIMVKGGRDDDGVANVCLQPIVVLGLAFLAAEYPRLPARLRGVLWAGAALDFVLGIALHFHVEHLDLLRPGAPALTGLPAPGGGLPPFWSSTILSNLLAKAYFGLEFLGDRGWPAPLLSALLLCLFLLAARRLTGAGGAAEVPAPARPATPP
ncbi:MAG TPA: hypothetical protein VMD31_08840 [Opitutaceae bacterium]|nr:hypothetical protein [Opitutaceae bacterium]